MENEKNVNEPLLKVEKFSVKFKMYERGLRQKLSVAVRDLNLELNNGEILAIVGSSGSGKSLLAHGIMDILPSNAVIGGEISIKGEKMTPKLMDEKRGKEIVIVPQSVSYLDPLMKIREQVFETSDRTDYDEMFAKFGLSKEDSDKLPFQLSGGMARRALVMTAAVSNAELIIADEPTPGLNPKLAHEILAMFKEMANNGKGVLLITHDIDLVCEIADRIAIFHDGTILETTDVKNFIEGGDKLKHPYCKALWNALPQNNFTPLSSEEVNELCEHAKSEIASYDSLEVEVC